MDNHGYLGCVLDHGFSWVVSWIMGSHGIGSGIKDFLGSVLDHGFSWDRFWYQGFLGFSRLSLISMSSRILG
jgi:hypothetical protein